MKKVLVVFGTRPEAIKMCPVIKALYKLRNIETYVCVTGQHKEMLQQVLDSFQIEPDFNLAIMKKGQSLVDITNKVLSGFTEILEEVNPNLVLVHGDTSTTFASALAAYYKQIPVGHVEAGLRTGNIYSPFPEEFNRCAVSIISKYNFAPTEKARDNLLKENCSAETIYVTGNTAIDALKTTVRDDYESDLLKWAEGSRLIVLTAHRRENLGKPLHNIFKAIRAVVEEFEDIKVVYPIHMNPIIRGICEEELGGLDRIRIIDPLDVLDFHNVMARSFLILTDSGGIQEEAPSLGKPVLVMRDTTERPEGVEAGTLKLVGTEEKDIYDVFKELLVNEEEYESMSKAVNPYGDGFAATRIAEIIKGELSC